MSKQKIMDDLDALLADLQVSVPTLDQSTSSSLPPTPGFSSSTMPANSVEKHSLQSFRTLNSSDGGLRLVDSRTVPAPCDSSLTTKNLSSNLQELDSLLDDLDSVEFTSAGCGDCDTSLLASNNNNCDSGVFLDKTSASGTSRHSAARSSATLELDELMGSLSDSLQQSAAYQSTSSSRPDSSNPSPPVRYNVTVDRAAVSRSLDSNGSDRQNSSDLSALLDALDRNLAAQGVDIEPKGACAACRKPIVGRVVTAVGRLWHPEHFVCIHCAVPLGSCNYFERDSQPYCERDYYLIFSPKCSACAGPILDKCITAVGKTWHPEHFCCAHCGRQLTEKDGFHEKDGSIFCSDDFMKVAPKCQLCSRPIVGGLTSAFGRDWHSDCFVCFECKKPFGSGRFFEGSDGKPYCEKHIVSEGPSAALCASCKAPILGRCVAAMSRRYHPEHFVCSFCRHPLIRGAFKELEGRPYCIGCFTRLAGR